MAKEQIAPEPATSGLPTAFRAPSLPWRALRVLAVGSAQAASLAWVSGVAWGAFEGHRPTPTWALSLVLAVGLGAAIAVEVSRRPIRGTLVLVFLASCVLVAGETIPLAPMRDLEAFVVGTSITAAVLSVVALVALGPLLLFGALARHAHARAVLDGDRADGLLGFVAAAVGLAVIALVDARIAVGPERVHALSPAVQLALSTFACIACAAGLALLLGSYARGSMRAAFVVRVERGEEPLYRVDELPEGAILVRVGEPGEGDYRAATEDAEMFPLASSSRSSGRA